MKDTMLEKIVGKMTYGEPHKDHRNEWVVPLGDDEGTVGFVKAGSESTAKALAAELAKRTNCHKNLKAALRWALTYVENVVALADRNDPDKLLLRKAKATLAKAEESNV